MYLLKSIVLATCLALVLTQTACTKSETDTTKNTDKEQRQVVSDTANAPKATVVPPVPVAKVQPPRSSDVFFKLPFGVPTNEEQNKLIVQLKAQYADQIEKHQQVIKSVFTDAQQKARLEATKLANEKGLKGKENTDFVNAKVPPTAEQKAKIESAQKELAQFTQLIQTELRKTFTEEQKTQIQEAYKAQQAEISTPATKNPPDKKATQKSKVKTKF